MHFRYGLFLGIGLLNYQALYTAFQTTDLTKFLSFTDLRIQLLQPGAVGMQASYGISDITLLGA